ncbi:hypothetical protein AOQ73_24600 [Bradyrhizobium pachyrhizi]|uniref:hypothetical protein n=1 Tax=Bradyrhizobium pachyrhizi TaxID=280333 RepID=UPI0007050905|nr:hypothetical protein [Bradyrhizobium pachyrhizi]KRP91347.1 hypothetical protein AOQ73_24600 [Bradyrhizobium pachyrhizi]
MVSQYDPIVVSRIPMRAARFQFDIREEVVPRQPLEWPGRKALKRNAALDGASVERKVFVGQFHAATGLSLISNFVACHTGLIGICRGILGIRC